MSEWVSKPLGKAVTFQKGRKVETSAEELPGYLRYLGAGSLVGKNDGYASTVNAVRATSKDVLMLWDGERSGLVGYNLEGVVSSTVSKLATLGEVTAPYLYYFLSRNFEWIQNRRTGTGVPHVPKDLGRIMAVDFPKCKNTQKKITGILQTIDDAIEQTEALIEKYSLVKAGMMHDLFTRGLTPDGKLRPPREEAPDIYKETPIGWIPIEWEFKFIADCANIHNNLRLPLSSEVREGMRGEYPYYGPTGIVGYINEFRANGTYVLIGEDGDHFLKYFHKEMTQKVAGKFNVNNHAHILSGKDGCSTDWLFYYFLHRDITFWLTRQGAGRYKLNKAALQKLPLALPKPGEQEEIAKHISFYRNMLDTNHSVLAKLQKQKKGLMHDLLSGEVPVNAEELEGADV